MSTEQHLSREQIERDTADALIAAMLKDTEYAELFGKYDQQKLVHKLHAYSTDALLRFASAEDGQYLFHMLTNQDHDEGYLLDWITLEPYAPLAEMVDLSYVLRALPHYEDLAPRSMPQKRDRQIIAILRVTGHLVEKGHGFTVEEHEDEKEKFVLIKDGELRDLITTHENPGAVADIITRRDITDVEHITALLATMDHGTPAINEGTL